MTSSTRASMVLVVGAALLALVFSAIALLREASPNTADPETEARLVSLESEVARLAAPRDRPVDTRRARLSADGAEPEDPAPSASGADSRRLDALAAAVADLAESIADTDERVSALSGSETRDPMKAIRDATPTPEQVAALRELVLDEDAETRPRLLALRELARVPGGRTMEVARAMRGLFEGSEDERTRTAVVAFLEGVVDPELEQWLVDTLLGDRYSSTRESATDALSHYVGSQRVRDALADAAENDTNHDVRADAQNALDKIEERERDVR